MKINIVKTIIIIIGILLLIFGFTKGMEWYRILSVFCGGFLLGVSNRFS